MRIDNPTTELERALGAEDELTAFRKTLMDALRRDVGKPSGANLGRRSKPIDTHALAMLAVRYPNLAKELKL